MSSKNPEDLSQFGDMPPPLTAEEVLCGRKGRRQISLTDAEKQSIRFGKDSSPIYPFVMLKDLNNQNEKDILDCNPEHNTIIVGIRGTF